ncbi:DUF2269 family protein [Paenarthrobacter sp. Z7-10]|uniref:DUF2269 family protein n=1 Tax=Paenarthrobacter sp. Z7-10 TaxID=2787635 RepID=UPI0022A93EB5|nr:DUF2269 family protein [Paenarthrobacter sp. Z7-10]
MNVLHVVAAVFIVGPMTILPMTAMRALRSGAQTQVASLAKSTYVFSLLSLIVVVFGFGLMGMSDPKYHLSMTTPWILISIIAYVLALVLNLAVVVPALRHAGSAVVPVTAGSGTQTAANSSQPAGKGYQRISMSSGIVALLMVLVVVLMVWRP